MLDTFVMSEDLDSDVTQYYNCGKFSEQMNCLIKAVILRWANCLILSLTSVLAVVTVSDHNITSTFMWTYSASVKPNPPPPKKKRKMTAPFWLSILSSCSRLPSCSPTLCDGLGVFRSILPGLCLSPSGQHPVVGFWASWARQWCEYKLRWHQDHNSAHLQVPVHQQQVYHFRQSQAKSSQLRLRTHERLAHPLNSLFCFDWVIFQLLKWNLEGDVKGRVLLFVFFSSCIFGQQLLLRLPHALHSLRQREWKGGGGGKGGGEGREGERKWVAN